MFLKFTSEDLLAAFRTRGRSETCPVSLFQMFCFIVFKLDRIIKIMKPEREPNFPPYFSVEDSESQSE